MQIVSPLGYVIPNIFNHKPSHTSVCIFAHGITAEKTEGGILNRQAEELNTRQISTIQFDFVGHGESDIKDSEMTIAKEVSDLEAVIDAVKDFKKVYLLAASFGAVATGLLPASYKDRLDRLCLWNPVLSLKKTFVEPQLPWQFANFGREKLESAISARRNIKIDNAFEIGPGFMQEVIDIEMIERFSEFSQPICVIHGDRDTYVSYDVAQHFCSMAPNRKFVRVPESEHGFGRPQDEALVMKSTTEFFSEV